MHTDELILRDKLAVDRTRMANQRTLLAFVRTGLYFIVAAIGIMHLEKASYYQWLTGVLIGVGVIAIAAGFVNYLTMRRKIRKVHG
ncbi:MAG: DUF202 domain-containing protein [Saprospiraceae bacterium]